MPTQKHNKYEKTREQDSSKHQQLYSTNNNDTKVDELSDKEFKKWL
jgi:hypothetical protein